MRILVLLAIAPVSICLGQEGTEPLSPNNQRSPVVAVKAEAPANAQNPPAWAADAIWYQILVPRFDNAHPANDPADTLPWTDDWARLEVGEKPPLRTRLFYRRYGGDLQGVRRRLPYLRKLGANTLYLNPIFHAASQHKYDTADHRHIDPTLAVPLPDDRGATGGDVADDWSFNQSDRLFLRLLDDAHSQGFRVVLDGVFNHVGQEFWAWQDVLRKGRESSYADWFAVTDWGPPLRWDAWDGPNGRLVEFRQTDDGLDPAVEDYLFRVVARWMDPDGDGDPSDGIDGWRLDAADKVPHGFWRRFHKQVKSLNPDALILGEIWTDPAAWLDGTQFDVVTNYPFAKAVIRFCGPDASPTAATEFSDRLVELLGRFSSRRNLAMVNLLDSHDTERAVTALCKSAGGVKSRSGRARHHAGIAAPSDSAYRRLRVSAGLQFTLPGSPMIYYGDEVGMYGGNDPFCRAPMWWPETAGVRIRTELIGFYRQLAALRQERVELRRGRLRILLADDARRLVAFERSTGSASTVVVANVSLAGQSIRLNTGYEGRSWRLIVPPDSPAPQTVLATAADHRLALTCPPLSVQIVVSGH